MKVSRYLPREHILADVPPGERDAVLRHIVDRMVELGLVPEKSARTVLKGVLEREQVGSTGIGRGIALPHVKTRVVEQPTVVFTRLAEPIPYGAIDGAPVHSLFLIVSPPTAAAEHVVILKWVAALARSDYYCSILQTTRDASSLFDLFREIDGEA